MLSISLLGQPFIMVYGTGRPIVRRSFCCWIHGDLSLTWIDRGKRDKRMPNYWVCPQVLRCVRDLDWRYFHKRQCRCFLSIPETQHLFKQFCEFSYFTFDALNFPLIMSLYLSPFFIFHIFSQSGVVDHRWGDLRFNLGACMLAVWAYFYMMNLPFKGVKHGCISCMMKQEFWFFPKLYNKNFLSGDHCIVKEMKSINKRLRKI